RLLPEGGLRYNERGPPGAQTERRSGAGPVRGLLSGKTSPAACSFSFCWSAQVLAFRQSRSRPSPRCSGRRNKGIQAAISQSLIPSSLGAASRLPSRSNTTHHPLLPCKLRTSCPQLQHVPVTESGLPLALPCFLVPAFARERPSRRGAQAFRPPPSVHRFPADFPVNENSGTKESGREQGGHERGREPPLPPIDFLLCFRPGRIHPLPAPGRRFHAASCRGALVHA